MMGRFAFVGHEAIGEVVDKRLGDGGWDAADRIGDADVVITYCLTQGMLEDAYFDGDGVIKNACAGTLLIDLSPTTPSFAREISAVATVNDLRPVEAPLAAKDPAGAGLSPSNLKCFVAGEPDDRSKARAVLELIAGDVVDCGRAGSAQLAKAVHTMQMASQVVAATEAEALMRVTCSTNDLAFGFSLADALDGEAARGMVDAVEHERVENGYAIELFMADVAAAMAAADDIDLILPQLEAAMHLLELIAVIGGADLGVAALSLLYREEEASAAHGLDWSRAEGLYASGFEEDCDHDHGQDLGYDDGGDQFGFLGGIGGFSAN